MNTTITLSRSELEIKLQNIDLQIKDLQNQRSINEYLLQEYFGKNAETISVSELIAKLDSSKNTKPLIIDILKYSGTKMKLNQVQDIFVQVKPDISQHTVRVSLFELGRKSKYPVNRKSGKYWYEEKI